jgi:hypothetical protein
MSTHSREVNFALPAVFEEQQAQQVWLHLHKIDFNPWVFPNPFLMKILCFPLLIIQKKFVLLLRKFFFPLLLRGKDDFCQRQGKIYNIFNIVI